MAKLEHTGDDGDEDGHKQPGNLHALSKVKMNQIAPIGASGDGAKPAARRRAPTPHTWGLPRPRRNFPEPLVY